MACWLHVFVAYVAAVEVFLDNGFMCKLDRSVGLWTVGHAGVHVGRTARQCVSGIDMTSDLHELWGRLFLAWGSQHVSVLVHDVHIRQEAQLLPSDRVMRLVSSNLANYQATVQKILTRQVLTKPMVWSWRFSRRQCVINVCTQPRRDRVALIVSGIINKPTTDELCISHVYRRLAVVKFSKSTM